MTTEEQYRRDLARKNALMQGKIPNADDLLWYYSLASYMVEDGISRDLWSKVSGYAKAWSERQYKYCDMEDDFYNMYLQSLLLEAPYLVDSFFTYIEVDTPVDKRFYYPRKERLKPIVEGYQEVYDGKLDFLSVSQPKRTGRLLVA